MVTGTLRQAVGAMTKIRLTRITTPAIQSVIGVIAGRVAKWLPDAPKRLSLAAANIAVSPLYFIGWACGFLVKSIRVSVGAVVGGYKKGSEL